MKRLLDTHLLIWASFEPHKLPDAVRVYLENEQSQPFFSIASLWD